MANAKWTGNKKNQAKTGFTAERSDFDVRDGARPEQKTPPTMNAFSKSPSTVKTFNAAPNAVDNRLGFIAYDELVTSRIRVPMVVNPMGRDYLVSMREVSKFQPSVATAPEAWDVASVADNTHETVPGVLSLDVEFTPAAVDYNGNNITTDIFLSKWIASRFLDNMVKNWQQGDIGAVETSLMMIRAFVAHVRRILTVMRDVYQDSTNLYYSPVALLHALGLYMSEEAIRENYEHYWTYFNKSIIGLLNSVKWINGCPGHYRWESLFQSIYKDNPAKTRYTQLFILRPATMYTLATEEDGWHLKAKRKFSEYFDVDATNPGFASNPQGFWMMLHDLNSLIRETFYDDSVQDMLATINAIDLRGSSSAASALGGIQQLTFDYMDFVDQVFDFPLTYDLQMLLAIHNATICKGLQHSDITIDPKTGEIQEKFWGPADDTADFTRLALLPKIINMPTYTPTQSDMFNATQWTVVATPGNYCAEDTGFRISTFGSDVIVGAHYTTRNTNTAAKFAPTDPAAFTGFDYSQVAESVIPRDYDQTDCSRMLRNIMYAMQFAFSPQIYIIENHEESGWFFRGCINQSEIYFLGDDMTINGMHGQWLHNFWGYPLLPNEKGSPNFGVNDTEISAF